MEESEQLKFKSAKEKEEFIKENAEKLHMIDFKDVEFEYYSSDNPIDIHRVLIAFYNAMASEERKILHDMMRIHNEECVNRAVRKIAALIAASTAIIVIILLKW